MVDPQALANFAATQERPAAPPTSVPGAIGAAAAAARDEYSWRAAVPFTTQIPAIPARHGAGAGAAHTRRRARLGDHGTSQPAPRPCRPLPRPFPAPSAEKGQQASPGYLGEADLRALPQSSRSLDGPRPARRSGGIFARDLPGGFGACPRRLFYFLDGERHGGDADPALDRAKLAQRGRRRTGGKPARRPVRSRRPTRSAAIRCPGVAGAPAPHIEQSPTYGKTFRPKPSFVRKTSRG